MTIKRLLPGLLLLVCVGCGRVDRQMTINTQPTGALVYLNGQEAGRTPCTIEFTWYGRYDVVIRKEGYQTLKTTQSVVAPWWQWIPLDLVADVTPFRKVDRHRYQYSLQPQPDSGVPADVLIDRAQSMRPQLESGEFTRTHSTLPATTPSRDLPSAR